MEKKILVVDNNPAMLAFMTALLEKRGHQVVTAIDGLSALEILETDVPDLLDGPDQTEHSFPASHDAPMLAAAGQVIVHRKIFLELLRQCGQTHRELVLVYLERCGVTVRD